MDDDSGTSGPGRERTLDVECTLTGRTVPPGIEVGKPGKLADKVSRADQGFTPPAVTTLRAASALRVGEVGEQAVETGEATSDPLAEPRFHSGAQATRLFFHNNTHVALKLISIWIYGICFSYSLSKYIRYHTVSTCCCIRTCQDVDHGELEGS